MPKPSGVRAHLNRASVHCYLEVHIEQGPVLLRAGKPLGVVTGIRGNLRYRYCRIDGAYSHAGGIPRAYRQDAVFAFVEFAHGLEERCRTRSCGARCGLHRR